MFLHQSSIKFSFILIISILFFSCNPKTQSSKGNWKKYKHIEQSGFSSEKLAIAKNYYDSLNSSAFLIIQNGKVVANWGDIDRRFIIHSTGKATPP